MIATFVFSSRFPFIFCFVRLMIQLLASAKFEVPDVCHLPVMMRSLSDAAL